MDSNAQSEPSDSVELPPATVPDCRPLRAWPFFVILAAMVTLKAVPLLIADLTLPFVILSVLGPAVLGCLILILWLAVSRASKRERIAAFVAALFALGVTVACLHESLDLPGIVYLTIPVGTASFAVAVILGRNRPSFHRLLLIIAFSVVGFGSSTLFRNEGMWGDASLQLRWRWSPTPDEMLAGETTARDADPMASFADSEVEQWLQNPEWSGFRGPDRSSQQRGLSFASDFSATPPKQLWKIPIGPGWSSFAVAGKLLFTQEQRVDQEAIVCYHADSGHQIWIQQIKARFSDPLGGPGPRATPTLSNGAVFALGASGELLRLDAKTGDIIWQTGLQEVAGRKPPEWGFSSSPLVVDSVVVVHAGGDGDKGTLAFDIETGELEWSAAAGDHSYSSPQLNTVAGERVILMLTNDGLDMLNPKTGASVLTYDWKSSNYRALQPQVMNGNSIILPTEFSPSTCHIHVSNENGKLTAKELWTSRYLKGDFNDFVSYQGNLYGFDGAILACVDLKTGQRRWKKGRYGKGQVLLLEDSGMLLVTSEYGDVVLLKADPAAHVELSKFTALEGKTWNHPVVIGDRLYIRNSQEAACYELPTIDNEVTASAAER